MDDNGEVDVVTRRATRQDIARSGEVLGDAFGDYPWTRWTVDPTDHQARVTGLQTSALDLLGLAYGQVWVTSADDVIHSVAVWMDSTTTIPESVTAELARVRSDLEGSLHHRSLAAEQTLPGWQPAHRHVLLAAIGTTTTMQGQGLAGRTLQPMLDQVDQHGVTTFVETSTAHNVAFYRHRGFEVAGHHVIDNGGPDVWAMIRQPRQGTKAL